jgi:hypothetical protein
MPPTSSTDSFYNDMEYKDYEFYVDWAAFIRQHDFDIDTYYNLKDKLVSGSLLDYASDLGIKAVQVNLFDFIPKKDHIIKACSMHFPAFHWAAEHSGYNVMKIKHVNTEEKSCEDSQEYICRESDSYSYFSFSFSIDNDGLVKSPPGTFNFTMRYNPSSDYHFTGSKLTHTYKKLKEDYPKQITNDLGAQLHSEPGFTSITYQNYVFNPRNRYQITAYVERTRPENAFNSIILRFSASFTFDSAVSDKDFLLVIPEIQGMLTAEPEITDHSELIVVSIRGNQVYDGPETNPDENTAEEIEEIKDSSDEDDDEKGGKRKIIIGVVITVVIVVGIAMIAFLVYLCKKKKKLPQNIGSPNPVYLSPHESPKFSPVGQVDFNTGELSSENRMGPPTDGRMFGTLEQNSPSRI